MIKLLKRALIYLDLFKFIPTEAGVEGGGSLLQKQLYNFRMIESKLNIILVDGSIPGISSISIS